MDSRATMRIGVDTGGTFTDFIYTDGSNWGSLKLLSTPHNPAEAVVAGIERITGGSRLKVVHGSTVATNALLEKKGAKTALVTNAGFEDVIEIGRQNRDRLYDLTYTKADPPVPADLRFGVGGRIAKDGRIAEPLDEAALKRIAKTLQDLQVESVAVSFLFSFANPEHEQAAARILSGVKIPVSLSHDILAEFREFERTSTTVINAYVLPKIRNYIDFMTGRIQPDDLLIMQSNGGSISAATVAAQPFRTILSGPAGGVTGALEIGRAAGFDKLITFDMGGTSTDVALIDGKLPITVESAIGGFPVKTPMIDIHTVGAGGGSIARIDPGGALRVGPESAGADPGPVCYGKGEQITVTDANLFLGRLLPDYFLGGKMPLHEDRLADHMSRVSRSAGLDAKALARGVLAVANTAMEKAIRVISVEKGHDPRDFTLFSFGGAGGMHAAFLARELGISRVLVPRNPGLLSAVGMLWADIIKDYSQTVMIQEAAADTARLSKSFETIEARAQNDLSAEGFDRDRIVMEKYLDMRYKGQSFEIIVPFATDVIARFHRQHRRRYGYSDPGKPVEIVNMRLRAIGKTDKPGFENVASAGPTPPADSLIGRRLVLFDDTAAKTAVYLRDRLQCGNRIAGPAICVEYSSTIVIPPFASAKVDALGNLIIELT